MLPDEIGHGVDCWVGRDPLCWDRSGIRSIVDRDLGISGIPKGQGMTSMSADGYGAYI